MTTVVELLRILGRKNISLIVDYFYHLRIAGYADELKF